MFRALWRLIERLGPCRLAEDFGCEFDRGDAGGQKDARNKLRLFVQEDWQSGDVRKRTACA